MRCSNCSEEVKPIVAIDIDGTLGDYHKHFLEFAGAYLDWNPRLRARADEYDGVEHFSRWFSVTFDSDIETFRAVKLAYRQGGLKRTMPAYVGAADLVHDVRDAGAEVWLTTTRPYLRLDSIDPDTREWLRRYRIGFDYLLYNEDKYRVLSERVDAVRVVSVLEDLRYQVVKAIDVFGNRPVIWMRTWWNRGCSLPASATRFRPEPRQAGELDHARRMILADIRSWYQVLEESA